MPHRQVQADRLAAGQRQAAAWLCAPGEGDRLARLRDEGGNERVASAPLDMVKELMREPVARSVAGRSAHTPLSKLRRASAIARSAAAGDAARRRQLTMGFIGRVLHGERGDSSPPDAHFPAM